MKVSGSEAFVESLRKEGVEYICGIVGSAFMDPLDLFPQAGIRFIQVRHEQSAALMAEGYARATGKPGVFIGQNGPGITNLVTGVASAHLNHSPVIALTPSVLSKGVGTGAFQEVDQMTMLRELTVWQLQVNRPERMSEAIRGAFRAALSLHGPAQVDIPRDSYYDVWDEEPLEPASYRTSGQRGGAPEEDVRAAADALASANKVAIVAGLGSVESAAGEDIDELAELLSAPVAAVWQHNDAIINSRPLSVGPIGYQGSEAAMKLVADSDVILALGTRLNAFGTTPQRGIDLFPQDAKLIHNSIDPLELGALRPIHVGLLGDCRAVTRQLIHELRDRTLQVDAKRRREQIAKEKEAWAQKLEAESNVEGTPIHPRRAVAEVARAVEGDVCVVADVGNLTGSASAYFTNFDQHRRWFGAGSLGGIGVGYPTALGVKLGRPDLPVLALIGDGAWSMSLQEVMTAVREQLNVCAVVFNNSVYGAERRNQYDFFEERYFFTDLENPSFADAARVMGANAVSISRAEDIGDAVREGLRSERPSVIEIHVDPTILNEPYRRDALRMPVRAMAKYAPDKKK